MLHDGLVARVPVGRGVVRWMAAQSVTELTGRTAADNHYNLLVGASSMGS